VDSVKNIDLFGPKKLNDLSKSTINKVYMDIKSFIVAQCDADVAKRVANITCIPASRDAPRDETNHWYFEFN
jgi:hypothetical protein